MADAARQPDGDDDYADLRELGLDEEEIALLRDAADVRCDTPNPAAYHDPGAVRLGSDGRSLADAVGRRGGIRGTVIPRATRRGGSRAFDHNMPAIVRVVDSVAKTQVDVDFSGLTAAQFNGLVDQNLSDDPAVMSAITFRRLAKAQHKEATAFNDGADGAPVESREAPRGAGGRYVVPPSLKTGRQLPMQTPSARPRTPPRPSQPAQAAGFTAAPPPVAGEEAPPVRPASFGSRRAEPARDAVPRIEVRFEHPIYEMTGCYHHAVVSDDGTLLVLVFDRRCQTANRFEPKPPDGKRPEDEPILVQIVGRPEIYRVFVVGTKYAIGEYEHQLFVIDEVLDTSAPPGAYDAAGGYDIGIGIEPPDAMR